MLSVDAGLAGLVLLGLAVVGYVAVIATSRFPDDTERVRIATDVLVVVVGVAFMVIGVPGGGSVAGWTELSVLFAVAAIVFGALRHEPRLVRDARRRHEASARHPTDRNGATRVPADEWIRAQVELNRHLLGRTTVVCATAAVASAGFGIANALGR